MAQPAIALMEQPELISRKQLADLTDVRQSLLMCYSDEGLLPFRQKGAGLTRHCGPEEAKARLREIGELQGGD